MIKLVKILFGFVGFLFLLISLVGFLGAPDNEKAFVYVFFIMGAFSIWFAFKYKGQTKNTLPVKKQVTQIRQVSIEKLDVNRIVMQVLETIEIISTTRNLDTLKSRIQFLLKVFKELCDVYHSKNYRRQTLATIDAYKQLYYDKVVTEIQAEAVTDPLNFKMNEFICFSIYQTFVRNYNFQVLALEQLKTDRGKKGRYNKLLNDIDETNNLMDKYKSDLDVSFFDKQLADYKSNILTKI